MASYPEAEKDRLADLFKRWIAHYLHKSELNITLADIDLVEEQPMSLRKFVLEQKEEARKEAGVIYLNKGLQQGMQQGREEAIAESVQNLHHNLGLPPEQIAQALQLPLEKVQTILSK